MAALLRTSRDVVVQLFFKVATAVVFALAGVVALSSVSPAGAEPPPDFTSTTVLTGFKNGLDIQFLPDGRALVLERLGRVFISDLAGPSPTISPVLEITDLYTPGESGTLGFAVDPDYDTNGYIYVYYTSNTDDVARVSRFTVVNDVASLASEFVVWEDNVSVRSHTAFHFGGGLSFGPDGRLYLTIGDKWDDPMWSQDLSLSAGKVLRMNPDGSPPTDNPFYNTPGAMPEVWALGLRNPFRSGWDLATGRFFISEVGGNTSESWEDLHLGSAGANFGWPMCEGPSLVDRDACTPASSQPANFSEPFFSYPHDGDNAAIIDGTVYNASVFPAQYQGVYFYADYPQNEMRYLTFDTNGDVDQSLVFDDFTANIADIEVGPDGALYWIRYNSTAGRIDRISYDGATSGPVITGVTATPTSGPAPLNVTFSATAFSPGGTPLTYNWDFGDGNTGTGESPTHTYTTDGEFTVTVTVTDGTGFANSNPTTITVGSPPTASITSPADGDSFRAGDTISFTGTGSDPDETLDGSDYSWTVQLFHDNHEHPYATPTTGTGGSLFVATDGHDFSGSTGFEIILTVTDSTGLTATDTIRVYPEKVNVDLTTNPLGGTVTVDGVPRTAPATIDTAIGFEHTVIAPETFCSAQDEYGFTNWSDGGARQHDITVPETGLSLTADYATTGTCALPTGLVLQLEGDTGIAESGGTVSGWSDQSGSGNDLTAVGDPTITTTPSGAPAVSFEGGTDALERLTGVNALPAGSSDRTVFMVTQYNSVGYGGFAWGQTALNQAFGVVVSSGGDLMVQAWGSTNDKISATPGTGQGWLVQSTVVDSNSMSHFADGLLIDSFGHTYNTASGGKIVLGSELDGSPHLDMDVGAVLVFDRALTASERQNVEGYLTNKYLTSGPDTTDPVIDGGQSFSVAEDAANGDSVGTVTASDNIGVTGFAITAGNTGGAFAINSAGAITVADATALTAGDTYTLTVEASDAAGNTGTTTLAVTVVTGGDTADPVVVAGQSFSVAEDAANGTAVGAISASDNVGVTGFAITAGDTGGAFTIDNAGALTVADNIALTAGVDVNLTIEASDAAGNTGSATVTVTVTGAPGGGGLPAGAVVLLEADTGVTESGGTVTAWADQSGNGNDLTAAGAPSLDNSPSGAPAISFDGTDDRLERVGGLAGLPTGNDDRSVFIVADYRSNGYGGVSYGRPTWRDMFGLVVTNQGNLMVQGWGGPNDFDSGTTGTGAGWLTQGAVFNSGALTHYKDGSVIDTQARSLTTVADKITIGSELDDSPHVDMSVSAVVIYDRALTETERLDIETYLTDKYLTSGPDTTDPVVDAGQSFSVAEDAANGDSVGTVTASDNIGVTGFAITAGNTGGAFAIDSAGAITVADATALTAGDTYTLTVEASDAAGNTGTATLAISVVTGGDTTDPVVDAGQSYSVAEDAANGDSVGTVTASDNIGVTGFAITAGNTGGAFAINSAGALTVADATALTAGDTYTLTVEAADAAGNTGTATVTVNVAAGSDTTDPVVDAGQSYSVADDAANGDSVGTVTASDNIGVTGFAITAGNTGGAFAIDNAGAITVADNTALAAGVDFSLTIEAADAAGNSGSATVAVAVTGDPGGGGLPAGAVVLLEADTGVTESGGTVTAWADQSGNGNDLTAAGAPSLATSPSGAAAISFDGTDDRLERIGGLVGLPESNNDRSVFAVVDYRSNGYGGVSYGRPTWRDMFGLVVTNQGNLMVQGWGGPNDFDSGTTGTGAGWLTQGAIFDTGDLTHYKDGTVIDTQSRRLTTVADKITIGAELDGNPHVDMSVSAYIVYDRVLTESERQDIETYLTDKYLTSGPDTTDPVVDAGQSFSVADDAANGDSVGTVTASDNIGVTGFAITAGNTGGAFAINSAGALTVADATALTAGDTYTLTVEAADAAGNTGTTTLAVSVVTGGDTTDPVVDAGQSFSIADDAANGASVGAVTASDDVGVTGFAITAGNTGGAFAIDNAGALTVADATALTAGDTYTLTVEAADAAGNTGTTTVTVNVAAGSDTTDPVVDAGQSYSVADDAANGDSVGTVTASDNIGVTSFAITAGNTGGAFAIDNAGALTVADATALTAGDTYTLTVEAADAAGNTGTATVTVTVTGDPGGGGLPAGAVMLLEADTGVTESGGTVTAWADQSGNGNDLIAAGAPSLATSPSGAAAISFDGTDDRLERIGGLVGLPESNNDRSVFIVVDYRSNGYGGVSYGRPTWRDMFGIAVTNQGNLMVQGWGGPNDFDSGTTGTGAGWLTQGAIFDTGDLTHYKDGTVIDTRSRRLTTVADNFIIGAELDGNPHVDMSVSAVVIYDRALTETERQAVESYLTGKYL